MHRVRACEIDLDFTDRPLLRIGERIRQRLVEACDQLATNVVPDSALFAFERALAHHQHGLHPEQLVEGKSSARLFLLPHRLWKVDLTHRTFAIDETE